MTSHLSRVPIRYVCGWISVCVLAAALALRDRKLLLAECRPYAGLLSVPWKLAVFVPTIVFVTFAGRFTNDETWDVVCGGGMAILTFLTSGWAIGALFKILRGERPARWLLLVAALWLFSSSWFYDGYLFLRDGAYTTRWSSNLVLSPIIYLCAGLLLNLEDSGIEGSFRFFAFLRSDWPAPPAHASFTLFMGMLCAPLIAIAAFILIAFVRWQLN